MGNFSRNPDKELVIALDHDYSRVRFQQGKPALDRELNLAADLAAPQRLASRYLGSGVASGGTDFAIANLNVGANDFTITAGRCLVNGLEAVLRADTTYRTQPNLTHVAPFPAGASQVFLRVFEREVTAADDPALANPGDVTFETSVRTKVDWEVVVTAGPTPGLDHVLLADLTTAPPALVDRRRTAHSLAAVRDEVSVARGASADLGARLDVALTPTGAIQPNAVGLDQLKKVQRFNAIVVVPANADASVVFVPGDVHLFLLTSVRITTGVGVVTWAEFVVTGAAPAPKRRGIRLQNLASTPVSVEVQVFELQV